MKIGILGGTFNPVHIGHLMLGEYAYEQFGLDEIWFMPNGNPPHKEVPYYKNGLAQRLDMLRLAIEGVPYFKLNLHEANDSKHSFTYQTLKEFNFLYPEHEFYFIVGADSLFSIEEWRNYREIFPYCTLLAAMRDDKVTEDMIKQMRYLVQKYNAEIKLLNAPKFEISSSELRDRIQNHKSIRYMVPDTVERYIRENNVYTAEEI